MVAAAPGAWNTLAEAIAFATAADAPDVVGNADTCSEGGARILVSADLFVCFLVT